MAHSEDSKIDFVELDAANRRLGKLGEDFVIEMEKYLLLAGRHEFTQKVIWHHGS